MISQIFLLSPRGDTIIYKDFKSNVHKSATEVFFRKARSWDGRGKHAPPVFQADGVQYLHIKVGGLFWVATTRENVSPSLVLELLYRIYWIARDYFGFVSEDVVRKNFLLLYEILDEVVDYGLPQNSSTQRLKQFILMEPMVVRTRAPGSSGGKLGGGVTGPTEVIKSVLDTDRTGAKEEIFVDVVEKLTAIFDAQGHQRSSSIVGAIQMKSYLSGNPPIRLGLSEDLVLGRRDQRSYGATGSGGGGGLGDEAVVLDTYAVHEAADAARFERERVLELVPPEGNFALMTYRSSRSFRPPFRVYPVMEDDAYTGDKVTLYLRLLAEYPATKTATGVEVTVPLPATVQRVHCETDAPNESKLLQMPGKGSAFEQSAEWRERDRKLVWSIKNLKGGREHTLRARLTVDLGAVEATKRDYGPIQLQFVLPGKPSASGLDVKYMKILKEEKGYNPARWFRVVALANSYQIRPHT